MLKHSTRRQDVRHLYEALGQEDVSFKFNGQVNKKGDVCVVLKLLNKSEDERIVKINMYATAKYYIGLTGEEVDSMEMIVQLLPKQG